MTAAAPIHRWLTLGVALCLVTAVCASAYEIAAMTCTVQPTSVAAAAMPPCHGHDSAPAAPDEKPAADSKSCSPFCRLLCQGMILAPPTLAIPLIRVPQAFFEVAALPLPILPDTIDHVPLS